MPDTKQPTTSAAATPSRETPAESWTDEERAAMKEHNRELKKAAARRASGGEADGERDVLAKIAEMPEPDRTMAERIHAIVKANAPSLSTRTYYGMPAYAKDGKVVCFFQPASKFKVRYSTLGFQPDAKIDDGNMWPIAWALTKLTAADEKKIAALVKKAVE
jgi:uncharacterized protein YdhG (YjbR/CyaY superfamily)